MLLVTNDLGPLDAAPGEPCADLRLRLTQALAGNERSALRLLKSKTSVAFVVDDDTEHRVTLLLDRNPPAVGNGTAPSEARFHLTAAQAELFCAGRLPLPAALLNGDVSASGVVRPYLSVDAILRRLLADSA